MSKMKDRINSTDYKKGFFRLFVIFVAFVIAAGIGAGIKFGSRIPDIKSQSQYESQDENTDTEETDVQNDNENDDERGNKHEKEHDSDHEFDIEKSIVFSSSDWIFLGITAALFYVLLGIYWLYTTCYAISKANQVGLNPYIFGILVLFTNLFGVAVMWLWIRIHPLCPNCGKIKYIKSNNCSYCGTAMYKKCPECGEKVALNDAFCHHCGKKM